MILRSFRLHTILLHQITSEKEKELYVETVPSALNSNNQPFFRAILAGDISEIENNEQLITGPEFMQLIEYGSTQVW